jgi:repressor of nif and glnA expression
LKAPENVLAVPVAQTAAGVAVSVGEVAAAVVDTTAAAERVAAYHGDFLGTPGGGERM